MKKIRIFLSSSFELRPERDAFELEISRRNNRLFENGDWLYLDRWEDVSARIFEDGSQDEYNKLIEVADIFIILGYTKMGKYSYEEFGNALALFKRNKKPLIFPYIKEDGTPIAESLTVFKDELLKIRHFYTPFKNSDELWNLFSKELELLEANDFAGLGAITGRKTFNEYLIKNLILAIHANANPPNNEVEDLLLTAKNVPNWEMNADSVGDAKEILAKSFVGILGMQLSKLWAIGTDAPSETKQSNYIDNCAITCRTALELICFALISTYWNYCREKKQKAAYTTQQTEILNVFFGTRYGMDINQYAELLYALIEIFDKNNLSYPIVELEELKAQLIPGSDFRLACVRLQKIADKIPYNTFTAPDCYDAEVQLAIILSHLYFLASYKMVTIKSIGYDAMLYNKPRYLHHYSIVRPGDKNTNSGFVNYVDWPFWTDTILLYKKGYNQDGINLFPFIIDFNAIIAEEEPKICVFSFKDNSDSLKYRFMKDSGTKKLEYKGVLKNEVDLNMVMKEPNKRSELKLDIVIMKYYEARKDILSISNDKFNSAVLSSNKA